MAPAGLQWLLLAVVADGVAASIDAREDATALLQVGASISQAGYDDKACDCLSWKEVYAKHGVECGQGKELSFAGGMEGKGTFGESFCDRFFMKLSGRYCVQMHYNQQRTEQWCYVSSACQSESVGGEVGGVKWKQCESLRDDMLIEKLPEEVHQLAMAEGRDAGMFMKMAYPVYKTHLIWPWVALCVQNPGEDTEKCAKVRGIQATGRPVVFDSSHGSMPFGMIMGQKAWEAHYSDFFYEKVLHQHSTNVDEFLGNMTDYECKAGCNSTTK